MRYRSLVRSFEWIACAYFGYLIVACWLPRLSIGRRAFLIAASAIAAGIVVLIARAPAGARCAPIGYILAGYFLSGICSRRRRRRRSVADAWDRRLLGDPARDSSAGHGRCRGTRADLHGLLPADSRRCAARAPASIVDRYWTMVMGPSSRRLRRWPSSRPVRLGARTKPELADPAIHRLASQMVQHLSIRVNTSIDWPMRMDHNEIGWFPVPDLSLSLIASAVLLAAAVARAQPPAGGGIIEGFVTTQSGTIRLGGAQVVVHSSSNQEIASVLSDGDGHYRFTAIQEGKYTLTASLEGFAVARAAVVVVADQTDGTVAGSAAGHADADRRGDGADLDRVGGGHARLVRVDQQSRDRRVRQRQRARRGAASARERDRGARRPQHQGRTADPGRRPDRRQHAHRSGARPRALHAARRRHRLGRGDAEPVRGRVRALLLRHWW